MLRRLFLVSALAGALLTSGTAAAAADPVSSRPTFGWDVSGRPGLGFTTPEAPIGVRYLFNPRFGMDIGVGFSRDECDTATVNRLLLDGALLFALAPGDRLNLYLRPGARFSSEDVGSNGATTTVSFTLGLTAEVFVTRGFSVSAYQGIRADFVSPPPGRGEDRTDASFDGAPWTAFGFRYYLPVR